MKRRIMTIAAAFAVALALPVAGATQAQAATGKSSIGVTGTATRVGNPRNNTWGDWQGSIDIPAAARSNSKSGATAFVRFYFEEVNAAYLAPSESSAKRILQISTSTCKSCAAGAADIRSLSQAKQRLAEPAFAPLSGVTAEKVSGTSYRVSFTMSQTDAKVLDASGKVVDNQVAKSQSQLAAVVWKEGSWHMDGLAAA